MIVLNHRPHLAIVLLSPAFCLTVITTGCATPSRMKLSSNAAKRANEPVWWTVRDPAGIRPPIVVLEQRLPSGTVRQVAFCDRGLREFRYENDRLVRSGPPIPEENAPLEVLMIRGGLRHYARLPDEADGGRQASLPDDEIDLVQTMYDVLDLLRKHRPSAEVAPPVHLTYRQFDGELQHFPHGVRELLEVSKAF